MSDFDDDNICGFGMETEMTDPGSTIEVWNNSVISAEEAEIQ